MSRVALVTGATGFIGARVAEALLSRGWRVVGLARSEARAPALARVRRAVGEPAGERLSAVAADLTRPSSGLSPADLEQLTASVEVVFHCAGDTSFRPADPAGFARGHVSGPAGLLQMLARGRLSHWVHLSTAFVCGRRSGLVFEDEGNMGQEFHNAYERMKLAGEIAIRRAGRRAGVPVSRVRPAIVIGPPTGTSGATPSDRFLRFFRLVARTWRHVGRLGLRLRIEAAPSAVLQLVPLEYVVRGTVALGERLPRGDAAYHLVAHHPPTQQQLLDLFARALDVRGLSLVDARVARVANASLVERAVRQLMAGYEDYLLQDVRFDDRQARAALAPRGLAPPPIDELLVRHWIGGAVASTPAAARGAVT